MYNSLVALKLVGFAQAIRDLESVGREVPRELIVEKLIEYVREFEEERKLQDEAAKAILN